MTRPSNMTGEEKTAGQLAYEASVCVHPHYHDGTPRKTWEQLSDVERWSWGRTRAAEARPS